MGEPYPPPFISTLTGAPRGTVEAETPLLLPLLDRDASFTIFTHSTPGFEDVRKTCNTMTTDQPLAIVRPKTIEQTSIVVEYCSGHSPRIPIVVRSGGHNMWGRSLIDNGVVIDVRALDKVEVAEDRSSARIGGGIASGALLKALQDVGLSTPTGFCTTVGYSGWALGGGYSVHQGKFGLGCDQLLAAKLVTASGEVIDTDEDPELLWALRGAGNGNFGVVVEMTIKVYPCPSMLAGYLGYSLGDAKNVLTNFKACLDEEFPDEFSGDFLCGSVPGLGQAILFMYTWVQEGTDLTKAWAHLEKLKGIGKVLRNTVAETTPYNFAVAHDPLSSIRLPFHVRTRTVEGITPELIQIIQDFEAPEGPSHMIGHYAHGAAIKPNPDSCFANRMPHIMFGLGAAPPPPHGPDTPEMEVARAYSNNLAAALKERQVSIDSGYMNLMAPFDYDTEPVYGQETTKRLRALKKKYDEENVFFKGYPVL